MKTIFARLLAALALCALGAVPALATDVTLTGLTVTNYQAAGATAYVRVYYTDTSGSVIDSAGRVIPTGAPPLGPRYYTADAVDARIASQFDVGNPATASELGRVKMSVTSADPASPVAVDDKDPQLAASLPWINVKSATFGAVGNGTADDTAAINLAIAAFNAAGKGVLYFPAGTYKVTAGLTTITATGLVLGDGAGAQPASAISCTSATAALFTTNTLNLKFKGLTLTNTNTGPPATTPRAGAAIRVTNAAHYARVDYEELYIDGFYDGVDVEVGGQWVMRSVMVINVVRYGVRVRNLVDPDTGDWNMTDVVMTNGRYAAAAGLRVESSGGGKVSHLKINGAPPRAGFIVGVQLAVTNATSIFNLSDSSIENVLRGGVEVIGAPSFSFVQLDNIEFGMYNVAPGTASTAYAVYLQNVHDSTIDNVTAIQTAGVGTVAIELNNCARVTVGKMQANGFGQWVKYNGTYTAGGHTTNSGWNNVTFQNSWANYGRGYQTCQYTTESGVVHVRCAAAGGTVGAAMFTLPVGFRPGASMRFPTVEEGKPDYVEIDASGVVTHKGTANGNVMFSFSFVPK